MGEVTTYELPQEVEFLSKELQIRNQLIEITDLQFQNQHLKTLSELQQNEFSSQTSKLMEVSEFLRCFFVGKKTEINELLAIEFGFRIHLF